MLGQKRQLSTGYVIHTVACSCIQLIKSEKGTLSLLSDTSNLIFGFSCSS